MVWELAVSEFFTHLNNKKCPAQSAFSILYLFDQLLLSLHRLFFMT